MFVRISFVLRTLPWTPLFPDVDLMVEQQTLTLIEANEVSISLDLVLSSFVMSCYCPLGHFCWSTTSGKVLLKYQGTRKKKNPWKLKEQSVKIDLGEKKNIQQARNRARQ